MSFYTLVKGAEYGSSTNQPTTWGFDAPFMNWEKEIAKKKAESMGVADSFWRNQEGES